MSDYSDLMKNYASVGAQDLPPLIEKAADALGITGETEKVETLDEALARAYMAGINRGEAEIMAQRRRAGLQHHGGPAARALSGVSIRLLTRLDRPAALTSVPRLMTSGGTDQGV